MKVWREGNRIRGEDGGGYGDVIPDDAIARHVADALIAQQQATKTILFGSAVLSIRAHERRTNATWPPSASQEREGTG